MFSGGRKAERHFGIGLKEPPIPCTPDVRQEIKQDPHEFIEKVLEASASVVDLSMAMLKQQKFPNHLHNCLVVINDSRRVSVNSYNDNVVTGVIVSSDGDMRINFGVTTNAELQIFTISIHDKTMPYGGTTYEYRTSKHGEYVTTEANITDGRGNMVRAINGDRKLGLGFVDQIIIPDLRDAYEAIANDRTPATIG